MTFTQIMAIWTPGIYMQDHFKGFISAKTSVWKSFDQCEKSAINEEWNFIII